MDPKVDPPIRGKPPGTCLESIHTLIYTVNVSARQRLRLTAEIGEVQHMAIEFYNVKTRQKVEVDESQVKKVVYQPKGQGSPRYAVRAEVDGTPLTKFVSKATYDSLNVPEA